MSNYPKFMKLGAPTRWIVLVNRVDAAFFTRRGKIELALIERFSNPEGLLQERELVSDKPGRRHSTAPRAPGRMRHDVGQQTPHHEMSARRFVRQVARALTAAYNQRKFDELVLVAEPHMLGLIRKVLPKPVKAAIRHEIRRDYEATDRGLGRKIHAALAG